MSVTITLTEAPVPTPAPVQPVIVVQQPQPLIDPTTSLLERLVSIFEQFEKCDDVLSRNLKRWCISTLRLASNPNASSYEAAHKQIDILAREILVNPLYPDRMLANPYLDREWVWEKSNLDEYLALGTDASPFDGKQIKAEPHLFAQAMIKWKNSISEIDKKSSPEAVGKELVVAAAASAAVVPALSTQQKQTKIVTIVLLAQKSISRAKINQEGMKSENDRSALVALRIETEEKIRLDAENMKKQAEENHAKVVAEVNRIEKRNEEQVKVAQGQIDSARKEADAGHKQADANAQQVKIQDSLIQYLMEDRRRMHDEIESMKYRKHGVPDCVIL